MATTKLLKLPAFTAAALLISACETKIALPGPEVTSDQPPVIEISTFVQNGAADRPLASSVGGQDHEDVIIYGTEGTKCAIAWFMVRANHPTLGIRYLRMRLMKDGKVLKELVNEQFADANNQIDPSLSIVGTANDGSVGVTNPISAIVTRPVVVEAFALAYNFKAQNFQARVFCKDQIENPENYRPSAGGGGGGWPGGTDTPPSTPTNPGDVIEQGDFVEVDPATREVGAKITSDQNGYTAEITANPGYILPQQALLKSGLKSRGFGFAVGSISPLLPPIGGVAFDGKSKLAIVATFNPPALGAAEHVSFLISSLPGIFQPDAAPIRLSAYESDPSNPASTQRVRPRILLSPDSKFALVIGAPVSGPSSSLYHLYLWDIRPASIAPLPGGGNVSSELTKAKVSQGKIVLTFGNGQTQSITIP